MSILKECMFAYKYQDFHLHSVLTPSLASKDTSIAVHGHYFEKIHPVTSVCFSPLRVGGPHQLWVLPACERNEAYTRNRVYHREDEKKLTMISCEEDKMRK